MNTVKTLFATTVVATTFAFAAHAQDPVFQLPEQCNVVPAMGAMGACMVTNPVTWGPA